VAHTPAQRSLRALCGAKKKNGDTCRAFAGQGTDHPGVGRCKFHLGNTKNMRKHAVKLKAEEEVTRARGQFGAKIPVEPTEALLSVLHLSAGQLAWLHDELAEQTDKQSFDGQVLMRLWNDERDRVARIAKAALDAGVAERSIRLAETYGEAIATVLRNVLYDPELGLTDMQQALLPDLVRRHLMAATAEDDRHAIVRGAA
jgi:hypothetical protein